MTPEEAIFHLALLGMYADGHLAQTEDTRICKLMDELGLADDTGERSRFLSDAFDHVRAAHASDEATAAFLTNQLKPSLAAEGQKERALAYLKQVTDADQITTSGEQNLLGLAQWLL